METRYFYILRYAIAFTDILLVNCCFFIAFHLTNYYGLGLDKQFYNENLITCNLIWVLCTFIYALYYENGIQNLVVVYKSTFKSITLHIFLFLAFLFFSKQAYFPRKSLIYFYGFSVFGFVLSRFMLTALVSLFTKNNYLRKSVAVLTMSAGGQKLAAYLAKQSNINFVGFLGSKINPFNAGSNLALQIQSAKQQLKVAAESGIEEVFVSVNPNRMHDLTELIREGEKHCLRLKFVPDLTALESNFIFDKMGDFTVLSARKEPLENIRQRFKKRLFDIVVSLGVIVFIFSWLYPILALIIKLQSPGPVLFAQLRTGRNNKPFWCYKFRSMHVNAESDERQASLNDERITPIGKFMRKTSLDELPQFFNVLFGYMSIIGPRPHMIAHTKQYREIIDKYMVRQFLKPGISGWAQINGYRGETKETHQMQKRVEHDIWYMENWSMMLDLKIMFLTIITIFKGDENAY